MIQLLSKKTEKRTYTSTHGTREFDLRQLIFHIRGRIARAHTFVEFARIRYTNDFLYESLTCVRQFARRTLFGIRLDLRRKMIFPTSRRLVSDSLQGELRFRVTQHICFGKFAFPLGDRIFRIGLFYSYE